MCVCNTYCLVKDLTSLHTLSGVSSLGLGTVRGIASRSSENTQVAAIPYQGDFNLIGRTSTLVTSGDGLNSP